MQLFLVRSVLPMRLAAPLPGTDLQPLSAPKMRNSLSQVGSDISRAVHLANCRQGRSRRTEPAPRGSSIAASSKPKPRRFP